MSTSLAREVAERCVGDFKAQNLANTAWAFAMVGQLNVQLFTTLASVAERSVGDFSAQDITNTV